MSGIQISIKTQCSALNVLERSIAPVGTPAHTRILGRIQPQSDTNLTSETDDAETDNEGILALLRQSLFFLRQDGQKETYRI